jgi:tRNA nucleotidyltransferase (CCA-adding enzyme)
MSDRAPEHALRTELLGLVPPRGVAEIAERLEAAGHETWCVGGAVRDALLRRPSLDWDLATAAAPTEVQRLFRRTVPVGIDFGTVGVFDRAGVMHEVTTFRKDVRTDGRHAVVEFGASLDEDLARRDSRSTPSPSAPRARSCEIRSTASATCGGAWCAPSATRRRACARIACARCARSASRPASTSRSTRAPGTRSSPARPT